MAALYVSDEQLKLFAVANDSDATEVWELLADAVSRMFDRECEVPDGFFLDAGTDPTSKTFRGNGTRYVEIGPYIPDSITSITVDSSEYFQTDAAARAYREKEGFLIFDRDVDEDLLVSVVARWGFAAVASDIQFACIEQALLLWRKKDLSFADISGVSGAALTAELSPTFSLTTRRYRELYSQNYHAS